MLKILKLLDQCSAVASYEIQDFKQGTDFYFLKVRCEFKNDTLLYIRQYVSDDEYNYSYHWQNKEGDIIVRWDNAPHHRDIITFPHHKHVGANIMASAEIGIEDVLRYITMMLSSPE
ncbi:toxin-antitoxin system TumE family protein [Moorella sp. Hama-1]|uniref:toxin-antitoxin system TumE family protein n=1 Tax=Moorella sp. Hama-1 TaxID=2138101 RepID=UPI000D646E4D|nr:DUF6516 family protein [Moorella sp. Hama-1]MDN5362234.1 hypothetical protein [Moorella sp. (in: firmicutes)]BCV19942.1 hypothetical protein hamaS1_00110 [Moorella sp. Hama-1]